MTTGGRGEIRDGLHRCIQAGELLTQVSVAGDDVDLCREHATAASDGFKRVGL